MLHTCVDCIEEIGDNPSARRPRAIVTAANARQPRCATHDKAHRLVLKKRAKGAAVQKQRGITPAQSHELLLFQGGRCWLCATATGATKSLAHDHDHKHCPGETSCAECLRGRLCGPCNQFLGRLGDSPAAAQRLVGYLTGDTPWRRMVAARWLLVSPGAILRIEEPTPGWLNAVTVDGKVYRLPSIAEMLAQLLPQPTRAVGAPVQSWPMAAVAVRNRDGETLATGTVTKVDPSGLPHVVSFPGPQR